MVAGNGSLWEQHSVVIQALSGYFIDKVLFGSMDTSIGPIAARRRSLAWAGHAAVLTLRPSAKKAGSTINDRSKNLATLSKVASRSILGLGLVYRGRSAGPV